TLLRRCGVFPGPTAGGGRTRGRRYLCRCDEPHHGAAWAARRWASAGWGIPRETFVPGAGGRRRA
ncbi:MAG: hypothetical protein ACK55Z_10280, partial [bacterium]